MDSNLRPHFEKRAKRSSKKFFTYLKKKLKIKKLSAKKLTTRPIPKRSPIQVLRAPIAAKKMEFSPSSAFALAHKDFFPPSHFFYFILFFSINGTE